jgi:hypothetical protein
LIKLKEHCPRIIDIFLLRILLRGLRWIGYRRWEEREGGCRVLMSKLSEREAHRMSQEELWRHFAIEITSCAELGGERANTTKYVGFMSATRCLGDGVVVGDAALASGGLALLGSGCLHTLPSTVQQLFHSLSDQTPIPSHLQDNSCYRSLPIFLPILYILLRLQGSFVQSVKYHDCSEIWHQLLLMVFYYKTSSETQVCRP